MTPTQTAAAHRSTQDQSLPPRLEAVLLRLCDRLGPLTKTRAVKLPYLVDVVARATLGQEITEGTHQTWDFGVVTRETYRFFTHAESTGRFEVTQHPFSEGGIEIRSAGANGPSALSAEQAQVVDWVAATYGTLDAVALGHLTKSLNSHLGPSAWGTNQRAETGEDAYARLSGSRQRFVDLLPTLDLNDESNWGEPITDPATYLERELGG